MSKEFNSRSAIVLSGYLSETDRLPKAARENELTRKVSVVFNTYYPEFEGGFFFDHELVLAVCHTLCGADDVIVVHEGSKLTLTALEERWRTGWLRGDPDDPSENDLFEQLTISKQGSVRMMAFGELYYTVGGPEPYHDSATLHIQCLQNGPDIAPSIINTLDACHCRVETRQGLEYSEFVCALSQQSARRRWTSGRSKSL